VHVVLLHFFLPGRDVFLLLKGRMRGRRYMATGGVTTSRNLYGLGVCVTAYIGNVEEMPWVCMRSNYYFDRVSLALIHSYSVSPL